MCESFEDEKAPEGDLITGLVVEGVGAARIVKVTTERETTELPISKIKVTFSNDDDSDPVFNSQLGLIFIGMNVEQQVREGSEAAELVATVQKIFFATKGKT
jgi:hypothetical protein